MNIQLVIWPSVFWHCMQVFCTLELYFRKLWGHLVYPISNNFSFLPGHCRLTGQHFNCVDWLWFILWLDTNDCHGIEGHTVIFFKIWVRPCSAACFPLALKENSNTSWLILQLGMLWKKRFFMSTFVPSAKLFIMLSFCWMTLFISILPQPNCLVTEQLPCLTSTPLNDLHFHWVKQHFVWSLWQGSRWFFSWIVHRYVVWMSHYVYMNSWGE